MSDSRERARERWLAQIAGREASSEPAFLEKLRANARDVFAEQGFPHTRLEEWRYTNLTPIVEGAFQAAVPAREPSDTPAPGFEALRVQLRNGWPPDTLPGRTGIAVRSLREAWSTDAERLRHHLGTLIDPKVHTLAALNTATFDDGVWVHLGAGCEADVPVHLAVELEGGTPLAVMPRVLITADRHSRGCVVLEEVRGDDDSHWCNGVVEIALAEGAQLDYVHYQSGGGATTTTVQVRQARASRFASWVNTLSAGLSRQDLGVELAGEGCECRLRGLFAASGTGVVDHHTWVEHAVPHCLSDQLYKGIATDRAKGVFRGRVVVRPDAQRTDARQSNPNLLLDSRAEIDTKPQLEIYADDVRCSHGATVGRLDPEALFYLRTRGIDRQEAARLLVRGFAAETLSRLPVPVLAESLLDATLERIARGDAS